MFLMRDMERLCGPLRMAILYLGSGIIGNLVRNFTKLYLGRKHLG
jgi:membrane associated rhomboid family serine protease